jgi:predicted Zn-dependent peptidase
LLSVSPALLESEVVPAKDHRPQVVLAPRSVPTATMRIVFPVGGFDDDTSPGLTRLAQHALIEAGKVRYEKLVLQLAAADASLSLDTEVRQCGFTLTAPAADFEPLAREVAELVLAPRLSEDTFPDAMRRAQHDESEGGQGGGLYSLLASSIFSDARFQNDSYGDLDSLDGVGFNRVQEHVKETLTPGRATVVLAGGIEPAKWRGFFDRFKGGQPRKAERPTLPLPQELNIRARHEIHLLAYPAKLSGPRERAAFRLLAAVVDERANERLRADGLGYSVLVEPVTREWLDFLLVFSPLRTSSDQSLGALQQVVADLHDHPATGEELERNRRYALRELELLDAEPPALAHALAEGWASPEVAARLGDLSAADFASAVTPWLTAANTIFIRFSPRLPSASSHPTRGGR